MERMDEAEVTYKFCFFFLMIRYLTLEVGGIFKGSDS